MEDSFGEGSRDVGWLGERGFGGLFSFSIVYVLDGVFG